MNLKSASIPKLPKHLAIIMDGNGRWAQERGLTRTQGHKEGTKRAREVVEHSLELGIPYLTLYTFSQENWKRPKEEVRFLFDLLVSFIQAELHTLKKKGVQLRVLGRSKELPFPVRKALLLAQQSTENNSKLILNLALNYSGRQEILDACNALLAEKRVPEIREEDFAQKLYTAKQPDPDLLIRTSGEMRLSNFLPFQAAYAELYFTKTLWPDFQKADLEAALTEFALRQRRFGGLDDKEEK